MVQCDAGDINSKLIPCARHLLVEQRTTAEQDFQESVGRASTTTSVPQSTKVYSVI